MLLRVLKTLLRALPLLMGLVFTIYLILMHGPRLAVDVRCKRPPMPRLHLLSGLRSGTLAGAKL